MKNSFILFFLFAFFHINAQEAIGFLIDKDDNRIDLYKKQSDKIEVKYNYILNDDVNLTGQLIYYFNSSGVLKQIYQSKVLEMSFSGRVFKNLPITKMGGKRLHEILISNDKYMITNYFFRGNYFYIFRIDDLKMIEKKTRHSSKRKKDYKSLDKIVKRYFSNCSGLLDQVKKNIKNSDYKAVQNGIIVVKNNMFNGFMNYKCN